MELKHIKEEKCSDCGAKIIVEKIDKFTHSNGNVGEERYFACGKRIRFYPNYGEKCNIHVEEPCSNTKQTKSRDKKRKQLLDKVIEIVEKTGVDEEFKEKLLRHIKYT